MQKITENLAKDFKRWGTEATQRVEDMTKKYGVMFHRFFGLNIG